VRHVVLTSVRRPTDSFVGARNDGANTSLEHE
jgi:hypothetical protein